MRLAQIGSPWLNVLLACLALALTNCAPALRCVPTVGDLRSLPPRRAHCAYVVGYRQPGDGGGGHFRWDPLSVAAPNGGTVIAAIGNPSTGRWLRDPEPTLSVRAFGAVGDGSSDDTDAIQGALDAANAASGGVVFFPPGSYRYTHLSLDNRRLVTLRGVGGHGPPGTSRLLYQGTASPAISLLSAASVMFEHLQLVADNPAFTGTLLQFGHDPVAQADPGFCNFTHCLLQAPPATGRLMDVTTLIVSTMRNCNFQGGVVAIDRVSSYSNAIQIEDCTFGGQRLAAIRHAGESWLVSGCTFEPLEGGQGRAYEGDPDSYAYNLTFLNCWMGDIAHGGGVWIRTGAVLGLALINNRFASSPFPAGEPHDLAVQFHGNCQGVTVTANRFESWLGIDFVRDDGAASHSLGVSITGNDFQGGDPTHIHHFATQGSISILGNNNVPSFP